MEDEQIVKINVMYSFFNSNEYLSEKRNPTWDDRDREVLGELLNEYVRFYNDVLELLKEVSRRFLAFLYCLKSKKIHEDDEMIKKLENVINKQEVRHLDNIGTLDDIFGMMVFLEDEATKLSNLEQVIFNKIYLFTYRDMSLVKKNVASIPFRSKKWEIVTQQSVYDTEKYIHQISPIGARDQISMYSFLNEPLKHFKYFYDNVEDLAEFVQLLKKNGFEYSFEDYVDAWMVIKTKIFKEKELGEKVGSV